MLKYPVIIIIIMIGLGWYATKDSPRQPRVQGCYGECYEEYVRVHGTVVEQLKIQQLAAAVSYTHLPLPTTPYV